MKDYTKIDGLVDNSKLLLEVAYDRGYDKGWHIGFKEGMRHALDIIKYNRLEDNDNDQTN